jgi:hypothetical protein
VAFTYNIGTDRGKVRFYLSDTNEAQAMFTDAEVDNALTLGGSVSPAVCVLARARIGYLSRRPDESLPDGRSVSRAGQIEALRELLAQHGGTTPALTPTLPQAVSSWGGYVGSDLYQPLSELRRSST